MTDHAALRVHAKVVYKDADEYKVRVYSVVVVFCCCPYIVRVFPIEAPTGILGSDRQFYCRASELFYSLTLL